MHEEITIPELTEVVARVTALLGPRQGSVVQLEGGITNRNFRVNFGGTDYVVRLPGKRTAILGIDRTAECIANKAAAKLGMAPGVAAMFEEPSCLVTLFVDGREMAADELRKPELLAEVARDLRKFHDSGTDLPTDFDSFRVVEDQPTHERVPAHNDLLTANFLLDGDRIQLIDWEYAGMGDRWFDLGNFAANDELSDDQETELLEAYFGEAPDDRAHATLNLFRFVSDFREGMWGTVQSVLSEVDFDFRSYAQRHFERAEKSRADPRFDGWLERVRGSA